MTWKANKKFGSHGSELMWICTDCGFQTMNLSEYCPHCGIKTGYTDPKDKALLDAVVLIKENCIERTNNELDCQGCIFFDSSLTNPTTCKLAGEINGRPQTPEDWRV